jgi:hypothetical protein
MTTITSSSGVTFARTTEVLESTKVALNLGYYENDTTGEQLINKSLNVTGLTDTTGWTAFEGDKTHNLIDSFINFNPTGSTAAKFDIFDRSNATIFAQAARDSVFYDSTDRTTTSIFHISEVNKVTLGTLYYNVGYAGKVFPNFDTNSIDDRNWMDAFLAYATDKTGQKNIKEEQKSKRK